MGSDLPIGESILRIQEQVLDEEISKYDAILQGADVRQKKDTSNDDDDDDDEMVMQRMRLMRLQQLQKEQKQKNQWKAAGHGNYTEIMNTQNSADVAHEFFRITKESEQIVVHFYRTTTSTTNNAADNYCDLFHKHFETLAQTHLETKFCKLDVGRCSDEVKGADFLVERFHIRIIPTLLLIRNRKVVHKMHGFDEIHRGIHCDAFDVAAVLAHHGVLKLNEHELDRLESAQKENAHSTKRFLHHKSKNAYFNEEKDDDDKEDF